MTVRDAAPSDADDIYRLPTLFAGGTILELLELTVDTPVRGRGTGCCRRLGFHETAVHLKWSPMRSESC